MSGGRLDRTSRNGRASGTAGVLDDYGCVAEGFIALAGVTAADEPGSADRWLGLAGNLLETVLARFATAAGGFYDTADDSERLIYRPSDIADGPSPSGTFAVSGALLSYAALTGSASHRAAALAALRSLPELAARFPRAVGWGLAVAQAALSGPVEIAIAGPPGPQRAALHKTALEAAPPGAVIACGDGADQRIPLLAGRTAVADAPAAYVCRDFACRAPVTEPDELRVALSSAPR